MPRRSPKRKSQTWKFSQMKRKAPDDDDDDDDDAGDDDGARPQPLLPQPLLPQPLQRADAVEALLPQPLQRADAVEEMTPRQQYLFYRRGINHFLARYGLRIISMANDRSVRNRRILRLSLGAIPGRILSESLDIKVNRQLEPYHRNMENSLLSDPSSITQAHILAQPDHYYGYYQIVCDYTDLGFLTFRIEGTGYTYALFAQIPNHIIETIKTFMGDALMCFYA
jgi:hypothetical protein